MTENSDDRMQSAVGRTGMGRRAFLQRAGLLGTAAFGASMGLAACGSGDDGEKAGTTTATAADASSGAPSGSVADKYKGKTIGLAFLTLADPNVVLIQEGLEEAASKAGLDWKFQSFDGQAKNDQAQKGLQSLISKKVDLIYLEGIAPRLVGPQLAQAKSANIPVVGGFTAAPLDPGIRYDYAGVLESDSVLLTQFMLQELQEVHADKPEIKLAIVDSDLDVVLGRRKILDGLLALEANKKIKVVGAQNIDLTDPVGSSTKIASSFLTKNPDLAAIWTNYPNSAIASANAAAQKGKSDQVRVYGHIANAAAIDALREKGSAMSATSWIDFSYTAYATVGNMLDVFAGKEVARTVSYTDPVPATVLSRATIETQIPGKGTTWEFGGGSYRDGFVQSWFDRFAS
jgi:ABC-type sugar transport system substrate-binding protein